MKMARRVMTHKLAVGKKTRKTRMMDRYDSGNKKENVLNILNIRRTM